MCCEKAIKYRSDTSVLEKEMEELHAELDVAKEECAYQVSQVSAMKADLEMAAGDFPVGIPEPGSEAAILLSANVLLRRENEKLRDQIRLKE